MIVVNKFAKPLLPGLVVILTYLPLYAQTATNAPADTKTTQATSVPTAQAPNDVTNKITDLVHDGKYAEAQGLTNGLLLAYPNDQRLIRAKALLDKLLAAPGSANATPGSSQPANSIAPAQPARATNAEPLTGMDKVDYNALIELARQAQQTTDLAQQETLLHQFMDQSSVFLQKYPDQMLLWQLRAATAMSLNNPPAGYDAGQKLLALGAADSNDPSVQRLLADLKNKGWLDKQKVEALLENAEAARLKAVHDQYTFPVERILGVFRWTPNGFGHLTINENDLVYDGADGHVQLSKDEIREVKDWGARYGDLITISPKDGKTLTLYLVTEDQVTNKRHLKSLPLTALDQAVAERWKFVWDPKHKTLKPPGAASASSAGPGDRHY